MKIDGGYIYATGEELNAARRGREWPFVATLECHGYEQWCESSNVVVGGSHAASPLNYRVKDTPETRVWLGFEQLRWVVDVEGDHLSLVGRMPDAQYTRYSVTKPSSGEFVVGRDERPSDGPSPVYSLVFAPPGGPAPQIGQAIEKLIADRLKYFASYGAHDNLRGYAAQAVRDIARVGADPDGPPRIRSELGGLMAPGYHATGYTPRKVERVTLDDPTGDDIAGDVE
jgi:hypothetical protein